MSQHGRYRHMVACIVCYLARRKPVTSSEHFRGMGAEADGHRSWIFGVWHLGEASVLYIHQSALPGVHTTSQTL